MIINAISDTCSQLTSDILTEGRKTTFHRDALLRRQLELTQEPQVGNNYRN